MKQSEKLFLTALLHFQSAVHCLDDIENLPNQFKSIRTRSKNFNVTLSKELLPYLDQISSEGFNNVSNLLELTESKTRELVDIVMEILNDEVKV